MLTISIVYYKYSHIYYIYVKIFDNKALNLVTRVPYPLNTYYD